MWKTRSKKYTIWFIVNFCFCLLPLFVAGILAKTLNDDIFTSFLSYSFTLIISSIYVYDQFKKPDDVLDWFSWFIAILLMLFFVLYPDMNIISCNKSTSVIIIIGVVILISGLLSRKSIEDSIQQMEAQKTKQQIDKIKKKGNEMFRTLSEEG